MSNFFAELFNFLINLPPIERVGIHIFMFSLLAYTIVFALRLIKKRGLTIPYFGIVIPKEDSKNSNIPTLSSFSREAFLGKKKIGTIGFTKEVVVYRFFGEFWNSATNDSKDLYEIFVSEFHPPGFLSEKDQKKIEGFVYLDKCNIQTKLLAILRSKAEEWAHIYVIASRLQISAQELDLLKEENGGAKNITIVPVSNHF